MNSDILLKQPRSFEHPVRFGGASSPSISPASMGTIEELRAFQKKVGQDRKDLFFKPVTSEAPESKTAAGKRKMFGFGWTALASSLMLLASVVGWNKTDANMSNLPHQRVAQHNQLRPQIIGGWEALVDVSQAAGKQGKVTDPELMGRFNEALHPFLARLTQTMKRHPGLLDQQLANRLNVSGSFLPLSNVSLWANDFMTFMRSELRKQGVDLNNIPDHAINRINIQQDFLRHHQDFSSLSPEVQARLAKNLQEAYKANRIEPVTGNFTSAFVGAIGSGFDGITLERFSNLSGKADAIEVLKAFVNNERNLPNFTAGERQALVARGSEILASVQSQGMDVAMMLLCYLMAAGMGGLLILQHKKVSDAIVAAVSDLPQGLRKPQLVVNYGNLNNPEVKQYLANEWANIRKDAENIVRVVREGYDTNPDIREAYKSESELPTVDTILMQAFFDLDEQIKSTWTFKDKLAEPQLDEVAFIQKLADHLQAKYESGDFMKEGMPKGYAVPTEADVTAAKTPLEKMRVRRQVLEHEILKAKRLFLRHNFMYHQAVDALTQQQQQIAQIEKGILAAADNKAELVKLDKALDEAKSGLKVAEHKKEATAETLMFSQDIVQKALEKYRELHADVSKVVTEALSETEQKELLAIKEQTEVRLSDKDLSEIEKLRYDTAFKKARAKLDAKHTV